MRSPSFADVLDSVCRSAGIDPHAAAPKAAHAFLRGTGSRLHVLADRILEFASRAHISAPAYDPYLEHAGEHRPHRRLRKPKDPGAVAAELRISAAMTPADLSRLRREFALANHPDRVDPLDRDLATRRMMVANMLIDTELRRRRAVAVSTAFRK